MTARVVALALAAIAAFSLPASAQSSSEPRAADVQRHRFEVSIGGIWLGGAALGSDRAELRANSIPVGPFSLFTTDTHANGAPGFDGRIAYWLTRSLAIEGGFTRSEPELRTRISGDAEGAAALTVEEQIDQYFIDASAVWLIERFRFRQRTAPFVSAGVGYLRQLHEGRTLVETGQVYHVGGGLRHWLRVRERGWIRALGVRIDGRAYVLVDGVQFDDGPRTHGAFSGSFFVTF